VSEPIAEPEPIVEVSVLIAEPELIVELVSVVTEVESVDAVELPFPQAANAPSTNTNNNFFIVSLFIVIVIVDFKNLIPASIKGNPKKIIRL
jgi:hypothetical protein